jgi:hypothetical protein
MAPFRFGVQEGGDILVVEEVEEPDVFLPLVNERIDLSGPFAAPDTYPPFYQGPVIRCFQQEDLLLLPFRERVVEQLHHLRLVHLVVFSVLRDIVNHKELLLVGRMRAVEKIGLYSVYGAEIDRHRIAYFFALQEKDISLSRLHPIKVRKLRGKGASEAHQVAQGGDLRHDYRYLVVLLLGLHGFRLLPEYQAYQVHYRIGRRIHHWE